MSLRVPLAILALSVCLSAPLRAAEVVVNYEFSDGVLSSTSDDYALSSPGGTYWNRVDSSFFSGIGEYTSPIRDQLGNTLPPSSPFMGGTPKVVRPRRNIVQSGNSGELIGGVPTPPLGSLLFSPGPNEPSRATHVLEMIGAAYQGRYDIAVHFKPVSPLNQFPVFPPGSIRLTQFGILTLPETPVVSPMPAHPGFFTALFTDVQPEEMHIGGEGQDPQGWGISYVPEGNLSPVNVLLAGIQIRGQIPEPGSAALGFVGLTVLCAVRRSRIMI